MQVVSDVEFEVALKNDSYNKIMQSAAKPFRKKLVPDELERCKLIALWTALKNYKSTYNCQFTSYLYRGVRIECLRILKDKKRQPKYVNIDKVDTSYESTPLIDIIDGLSEQELVIYHLYYRDRFTLREIAKRLNYTMFKVRKLLDAVNTKVTSTIK